MELGRGIIFFTGNFTLLRGVYALVTELWRPGGIMLEEIYRDSYAKYRELAILGPVLDDFAQWLHRSGYRKSTLRVMLRSAVQVERSLRSRGARRIAEVDDRRLSECWVELRGRGCGGLVRALGSYFSAHGFLRTLSVQPTPKMSLLAEFERQLRDLRGLAPATRRNHVRTASALLDHIGFSARPSRLASLNQRAIETFICQVGRRLRRGSMQHEVAHLRCFLRYLSGTRQISQNIEFQIDTPRVYRLEALPRALPWEIVRGLLRSIDITAPDGLRDHAMLFLIATYGLRVSEVAALTLEDIHWREKWLNVPQRKTGAQLTLQLLSSAEAVLSRYLRHGRLNATDRRELFLKLRAPIGPLGPTAVSMVFARWSKRSGLKIPFSGAHCLRHSYAVNLMRQGTPLKTLGDLLGHRTADSTCMYLRLATEDLRQVALPLPGAPHDRD